MEESVAVKLVRIVPCLGLAGLALLGCSEDRAGIPGAPGSYTLRGPLRLTGYRVDGNGKFTGTQVVSDADGVQVELLYGTQVVGRTTTVDGVYSFPGLPPGAYVARSRVIGDIGDHTAVLTVVSSDLVARDTLRLASRGDLFPVPNPVEGETFVYFELPDTEWVDVEIIGVAGDSVRTLLAAVRARGLNQVRWDGLDRYGRPVPPALYWVTLASGGDYRAQLLFKVDPGSRPQVLRSPMTAATTHDRWTPTWRGSRP